MRMIDLEKMLGPMRLRAWGLLANFAANVMALYGLSAALNGKGGTYWLITGITGTVVCLAILSRPAQ